MQLVWNILLLFFGHKLCEEFQHWKKGNRISLENHFGKVNGEPPDHFVNCCGEYCSRKSKLSPFFIIEK